MRGRADYLKLGDYNAICDQCGGKFKASALKKDWQGFYMCQSCWEPRHPQDFVKAPQDIQTPAWTRNGGEDTMIYVCDLAGRSSVAGQAVADCMLAEFPYLLEVYA